MATWTMRATGSVRAPDLDEVRRALATLADCRLWVQLQAAPSWEHATFRGDDLDGMCDWVGRHSDASGLYYCINPVGQHLGHSLRVGDVTKRRWLLVDVDRRKSTQYKDYSATDEEHQNAHDLACQVLSYLTHKDWPAPVVVDSGNGCHLLYRVELPNDEDSRKLLKAVLTRLASMFDGQAGTIGKECHDARRIAKLPGTWARKGPDLQGDRPHRMARLLRVPESLEVVSRGLLEALATPPVSPPPSTNGDHYKPPFVAQATSGDGGKAYARAALERECGRMATTQPGDLNNQIFRSAAALGNFVASGLLDEQEVREALSRAAKAAGCDNPDKDEDTLSRGLEAGKATPRTAPAKDQTPTPEPPDIPSDDVATIHDLIRAGAEVRWAWEGWIPVGVLTAVAAKGGTGKTRFVADLLRRIRTQDTWPDGSAMTLPADALALWVVADNHHDEMVTLSQSFGIVDNVRINASKADPYGGVSLETADDYAALEGRIKAVRPALVVIDTVGNATDLNLSRQEDAKAFYFPLQVIARKYACAILCLTHLNATGQFLGRRVQEKVRVAIRMDQFEGEARRRLEVVKSNSKVPEALGVTMGDAGNEYDKTPPEPPEQDRPGKPAVPAALKAAIDWLRAHLESGPKRVRYTIDAAKIAGHTMGTLYRAKDVLGAEEFQAENYKYWSLVENSPPENA